nr:immunoglobulin heavy chain junction region [Macaca mulatta]MOW98590.1 immunoglobulin heavy chain junction region [Macaca mulatta]MOW98834.1 immunoglobulin heavy chain junction region [Macaca mulatta]MOW98932.1 immunoglobulin heavy chain junction region [Macaca mulatta]MOW98967.1 immunoglobulin heavy chain junction region [Macaca mulatta]
CVSHNSWGYFDFW